MATGSMATGADGRVHQCDHIKKLPDADKAAALMAELKRHAEPVLAARGWQVKTGCQALPASAAACSGPNTRTTAAQ
jgi:hypothetical protein